MAAAHFAEPLSRLWYAASMEALYFAYRDDLTVGYLWAEYRMRKEHEDSALRGKKTQVAARKGGEARGQVLTEQRLRILGEMQRYIDLSHSIARAAELAAKAGIGTSAAANAKLWHRNRSK